MAREGYTINGRYNTPLRGQCFDRSRSVLSRAFRRLRVRGIIERVVHTYRYYLTKLGKDVIFVRPAVKEMFVKPEFARWRVRYRNFISIIIGNRDLI